MMICTFSITCDACGKLAEMTSQGVEIEIKLPERRGAFGRDLCPVCYELAKDAVIMALPAAPAAKEVRIN